MTVLAEMGTQHTGQSIGDRLTSLAFWITAGQVKAG